MAKTICLLAACQAHAQSSIGVTGSANVASIGKATSASLT